METKEYFEKVMQDYNQNGNGRSLNAYCKDEGIDYRWLISYRRTYKPTRVKATAAQPELVQLQVLDDVLTSQEAKPMNWQVSNLVLQSPEGAQMEIRCNNLQAVSELLRKMGE
jgi:hypothetical protein